jgi:hypothetical protein
MRNSVLEMLLRAGRSLYGLVLPLYPWALRCRFEADMVDVFEQQLRGECEQRGFMGIARVWGGIGLDVIQSALPDGIDWQSALIPVLSLAGSFALFALFFAANGLARHCIK